MAKSKKSTTPAETPEQLAAREARLALQQATDDITRHDQVFEFAWQLTYALNKRDEYINDIKRRAEQAEQSIARGFRSTIARDLAGTMAQLATYETTVETIASELSRAAGQGRDAYDGAVKYGAKLAPVKRLEMLFKQADGTEAWRTVTYVPEHYECVDYRTDIVIPLVWVTGALEARFAPVEG